MSIRPRIETTLHVSHLRWIDRFLTIPYPTKILESLSKPKTTEKVVLLPIAIHVHTPLPKTNPHGASCIGILSTWLPSIPCPFRKISTLAFTKCFMFSASVSFFTPSLKLPRWEYSTEVHILQDLSLMLKSSGNMDARILLECCSKDEEALERLCLTGQEKPPWMNWWPQAYLPTIRPYLTLL